MPTPHTIDIFAVSDKDRDECIRRLGMTLDQTRVLHRYLVEVIIERNRLREENKRLREAACAIVPRREKPYYA